MNRSWLALLLVAAPGAASETFSEGPVTRTYAMQQTFTSQMREPNPFSNQEWRSTHTHTWSLVKWTQNGTQVSYSETTCGLRTDKVFGAETQYPESFIKAIDVRHRTGTLSGLDAGASFRAGPYVQAFGVNLTDPYRDSLPTDPSDPRIVDSDRDGNPGVTVGIYHPMVGTGHVFIAQRSVARLEGTMSEGGKVTGVVYTAPDMFKIDADRWWLKVDSPQRPHPDPKESPFVLVPVADGSTCEDVLRDKAQLFPD